MSRKQAPYRRYFKWIQFQAALFSPLTFAKDLMTNSSRTDQMPDFMVIGAQKAGTTWLHEQLRSHPQVHLPSEKEIHYFDWHYHRSLRWYGQHFTNNEGKIRGEITPAYCILPNKRIRTIKTLNPQLKLIFIYRNPIDRAWSHAVSNYCKALGRNFEDVSNEDFVRHFESKHSLIRGGYSSIINNWRSSFDPDQMLMIDYDVLRAEPMEFLKQVCDHLDIVHNEQYFQGHEQKVNVTPPHPLRPELRAVLENLYKDEIVRFGSIISRDLDHWISPGR